SIPGVLLPLDSVEEYSVQTQASAETGRNPGGAVNLIIKSGTNQPRGSAYYYNRNEALAALSPFAPTDSPKNKLRNEHYGFSLGGPIERDKTFFFTTYEHQNFVIGNQALATMQSAAVGSLISDYFQVGPMRVQNYSAVHNAVLGSSLTNQLLVGVNYFNQTFSDANSSFDPVRLGFNTGVSGSDLAGAPFLSITG